MTVSGMAHGMAPAEPWPVAVLRGWHPVAFEHELRAAARRPLARWLMDIPLVLFHDGQGPVALVDRCPHRNYPLSHGWLREGQLVCGYHGWSFDGRGQCTAVAGAGPAGLPAVAAQRLQVRAVAGLVWVSLAERPDAFPVLPPGLEEAEELDTFWWPVSASRARLLDAIENLLDPAHPHFLHPYLVRPPQSRRPVRVRFESDADGGTARYTESDTRASWLPRLFEGGRSTSLGRYLSPTLVQLAFENEARRTLAITVVFSPETQDRTRPFAHFATPRGLLPPWLKRGLIIAFHAAVLRQDRRALDLQAGTIESFGGPSFRHGPLDLFGPLIWERVNGRRPPDETRELELWL
jgi:phenylpropionate dioxygenase-like ring-hydroxylating dioxygenase large terminal subunit